MDDEKILDLYFERSENAIKLTKEKYENYCTSIAYRILMNKEDSEECVCDTWLSAWNSIPPNRPHIFSAFLGKITRNHALDFYRKNTSQKRGRSNTEVAIEELGGIIASGENIEDSVINRETLLNIINSFLEDLQPNNRIIFMQRYWYFLSVNDIAHQNNMSQSAVKMSLSRSREKLRDTLIKEGYNI